MAFLNIQQEYSVDHSIKSYEYHAFQPISGTQLNSAGEIQIRIENQSAFFHPKKSFLMIEGVLKKDANYADTDLVTFVNNGILHCFSNIRYHLSGSEIESLYEPGFATTLLGLARVSQKGPGLISCWYPDEVNGTTATTEPGFVKRHDYIIKQSDPKGTFRFIIPLEHILGFADDYTKVVTGMAHALTLVRKSDDDDAIFRTTAAGAGKVVLKNITWMMPKVEPNDEMRFKLFKVIESKETLNVAFRMRQAATTTIPKVQTFTWRLGCRAAPERPRYIIVGLQKERGGDQKKNNSIFDHCGVVNMYVMMNEVRYPVLDYSANFTTNEIGNVYKDFIDFNSKFDGIDPCVAAPTIDPISFKNLHPIFVFDVSKQDDRVKSSIVDVTLEMKFDAVLDVDTTAHAIIISDRMIKLQSDGSNLTVVY